MNDGSGLLVDMLCHLYGLNLTLKGKLIRLNLMLKGKLIRLNLTLKLTRPGAKCVYVRQLAEAVQDNCSKEKFNTFPHFATSQRAR